MKKSNKVRLALTAVVVTLCTLFMWIAPTALYSCANAQNDQQQVSVDNGEPVENTNTDANTAKSNTPAADGESTIPEGYVSLEKYNQTSQELAVSEEKTQALTAENSSLGEKLETAINENVKAQKEISTQKARADEAEKLADALQTKLDNVHPITVKNGKVWVHIDDFLNAANGVGAIIKSERGYAMRATSGTHVVIYDDMSWDRSFLVENFDLPMAQAYAIALTRDEGKTAFVASFGSYSWANGGLFTDYRSVEFARELTSMPKNGKPGEQFFALLSYCAVVTEVDGEYRFAIYAGDFEANPTPAAQPTTNPETVVREIVKEVTKTEKVYVDRCGRCGHLIEDCICEPEVKVVEKTNVIVKEVEKIIEKPVEPEKPDTPDEPEKPNKPDHNPRPDDSNTSHNDRPWDNDDNTTGDVIDGSDDDITGDIYDDDSDHNPREDDSDITGDIHDPFHDNLDITGGIHDPEYDGNSNSTDHSPREEDDITGDSNHSPREEDDITGDSNHSPREEENITSNSVDNEIDDITSNPVGNDTDNITSNFDDVDITGGTTSNSGTGHSERP